MQLQHESCKPNLSCFILWCALLLPPVPAAPRGFAWTQMAMAHTANKDSGQGAAQYSGHHHPAVSFNSNHNLPAHHMAPAASNAAGGGYGKLRSSWCKIALPCSSAPPGSGAGCHLCSGVLSCASELLTCCAHTPLTLCRWAAGGCPQHQ